MKDSIKNIIILITICLGLFLISKIQLLVIYFFIALVLSITINPISNWICKIKILKYSISKTIATLLCLIIISSSFGLLGFILSPLIIEELQIISSIQSEEIKNFLMIVTQQINKKFETFNIEQEANLIDLVDIFNIASVTGVFQSMFEILGNIFMAIFSILFISFFLIRDKAMIKEKVIFSLSFFIPKAKEKINTIIYFIRRYFIGLCIQTTILFILFGIGMSILKLPNPWILAVFAAVINIIPYFGPLIGLVFTSIIVGTIYIDQNMIDLIVPLIIKSFFLFGTIQSIDNFLLQPTIYSKAFNAHPLEIFLLHFLQDLLEG